MHGHTCTAACMDGVHTDLVYTNISTPEVVGRWIVQLEHVAIVDVTPAREAPTFDDAERLGLPLKIKARYTPVLTDERRWLVRWKER